MFNQTIEESNFSSDMQIPPMHFVFRITLSVMQISNESYSMNHVPVNVYSNQYKLYANIERLCGIVYAIENVP